MYSSKLKECTIFAHLVGDLKDFEKANECSLS
jgi:hypothetical protein